MKWCFNQVSKYLFVHALTYFISQFICVYQRIKLSDFVVAPYPQARNANVGIVNKCVYRHCIRVILIMLQVKKTLRLDRLGFRRFFTGKLFEWLAYLPLGFLPRALIPGGFLFAGLIPGCFFSGQLYVWIAYFRVFFFRVAFVGWLIFQSCFDPLRRSMRFKVSAVQVLSPTSRSTTSSMLKVLKETLFQVSCSRV